METTSFDDLKRLARQSLSAYAALLHPAWEPNWHHRVIAKVMENVASGDPEWSRVCIEMPPRAGKSELVSKAFPGWYMAQHPHHTVISCTYGADLTNEMGRDARAYVDNEAFRTIFGLDMDQTTKAITRWNLSNHSKYFATTVGSALTGYGANCVTGDTLVETEDGPVPIRDVKPRETKVLSWNFTTGKAEFKCVLAVQEKTHEWVYRVTTVGGRVVEASGEHRFYALDRGWRTVAALKIGDIVMYVEPGKSVYSIELDEVRAVERIRKETVMYDITVAENHNFFANFLLSHNSLLIDDPIKNAEEAASTTAKDRIWDWFNSTAYTRLEKGGSVVITATRWAEDDLTGRLLSLPNSPWKRISFPMVAMEDEKYRRRGDPLWPEKYPLDKCEEIKAQVGRRVWSALYQQSPAPDEGAIFRLEYLRYYKADELERLRFSAVYQSWDTGVSKKDTSARSACTTWGVVHGENYAGGCAFFLLDVYALQMSFPELRARAKALIMEWEPDMVWVEEEQTGRPLIDELRLAVGAKLVGVRPKGTKENRAKAVSAPFEAGRVYLPDVAPWLESYIHELLTFPFGTYADKVDSTTQAIRQMLREEYHGGRRRSFGGVMDGVAARVGSIFGR